MQTCAALATPAQVMDKARASTLLSPRFYCTDYSALDRIDVSPVRAERDQMMLEYEGDNNHDHFQRPPEFAREVRDLPPELHRALGIDSTEYDYAVFRITTEITKQVFPLTLNIEHPAFRAGLARLFRISQRMAQAKAQGGVVGRLKQAGWSVAGVAAFARLYALPAQANELPPQVRVAPSW